jgi:hypothetical protein
MFRQFNFGSERQKLVLAQTNPTFAKNSQGFRRLFAILNRLPNRLYSLVKRVKPLKPIEVVEERGLPSCLEIVWPAHQRQFIRSVCPQTGITVVDKLWSR